LNAIEARLPALALPHKRHERKATKAPTIRSGENAPKLGELCQPSVKIASEKGREFHSGPVFPRFRRIGMTPAKQEARADERLATQFLEGNDAMIASARLIASAAFGMMLVAAAPATAGAQSHQRFYLEDGSVITYKASTDQYCMTRPPIVGSHLTSRECHSQEEWAKLGLTITGK
jgi:hypothetical protein